MQVTLPKISAALFVLLSSTWLAGEASPRLAKAYRFEQGGWTYVHLEGSPRDVGFQHGYLLAREIQDAFEAVKLRDTHDTQRDWSFFRNAAHNMLWPHIDPEYRQELEGIADGLKAKGVAIDLDDVVALNAMEELADYYTPWLNKRERAENAPKLAAPGNCSAFIATGSMTKGHKIVLAHSAWVGYMVGERWTIIFDIVPTHGRRILMDGFPGIITSNDDFGVNSAGIMIAETTITQFEGWNSEGVPEFVRSRRALQYANSIDDYVRLIKDGNNGGYANDWLIGDRKTGEIAYLELGLKHTPLWRTKDGYFISSNFARDPKLIADEAPEFKPDDLGSSPNARRVRWEEEMRQNRGHVDVELAEKFLADHFDSYDKKQKADERALCGHADQSARGIPEWEWGPYYPGGTVQGKAVDSAMAAKMSLVARAGHPCGDDFIAQDFLDQHPEYNWQKSLLRDMKAGPWTTFRSGEKREQAEARIGK